MEKVDQNHPDQVILKKMAENLGAEKPQEKKITREQRRFRERIANEAKMQLSKFVSAFYECFNDNDPESEQVEAKQKELSAKWKMYCNRRGLSKAALGLFDDNCIEIINEYQENLKEPELETGGQDNTNPA